MDATILEIAPYPSLSGDGTEPSEVKHLDGLSKYVVFKDTERQTLKDMAHIVQFYPACLCDFEGQVFSGCLLV
jgi:hypothetical protein